MTDHPFDQGPGYYWASGDEDDDTLPPDAATLSAAQVNAMMGDLRRAYARVADYDTLHLAELDRLERRREQVIGPIIRRVAQLEATLTQYAVRAHIDFGKTGTILATPNGSIRASRPLVDTLNVDDALVAPWLVTVMPDAVGAKAVVSKAALREELILGEAEGRYVRSMADGEIGSWIDTATGERLAGVTWAPAGEQGCGRTFTVDVG